MILLFAFNLILHLKSIWTGTGNMIIWNQNYKPKFFFKYHKVSVRIKRFQLLVFNNINVIKDYVARREVLAYTCFVCFIAINYKLLCNLFLLPLRNVLSN